MAGIDIQHVPYRGIAAVMPDLIAGRLTMVFGNISAVLPLVRDGKLRALAVTSPRRWRSVPDLPTMIEAGFHGFDSTRLVRPDGAGRDAAADSSTSSIARGCASSRCPTCASASMSSASR